MANSLANIRLALPIFIFLVTVSLTVAVSSKKNSNIISHIEDFKELKKLLRTKTNVLVILTKTEKSLSSILPVIQTTADEMKGKATLIIIDCSVSKKLCKKLKMSANKFEIKHYHDGDFNRNYDRKLTVKSMIKFLQDPKGDIPWEEDPEAENLVHIDSEQKLNKILKKQTLPMLLMFYAPWCGFCKRLKPEFAGAATDLKGKAILAGLDADNPQFFQLRLQYNITGFPTIFYFENGKSLFQYGGESTRSGIVKWMANPAPPQKAEKEASLFDEDSNVEHLSKDRFESFLAEHPSVLIMFYAPWCGHCKKMKPEYVEAAATLKAENIEGVLAAVDATQESEINERFKVKGFPTVKYFRNGEYVWDFNERKASDIVSFMKDPKEPPPPPPPEPKWAETESDVHHLTAENFKNFLKKKKHSLVMFYAPWCGHCKKAKPEFTEAALQLKSESKVALCAVDCTEHTSLCTAHDVKGYPTLKYFNYGKNPEDYMGGRTAADFVNFLKSPNTPPTHEPDLKLSPQEELWLKEVGPSFKDIYLLSSTTFEIFISKHPSVLVMFYSSRQPDIALMKEFSMTATFLKAGESTSAFAAVDGFEDKPLAEAFVGSRSPVLKYFQNGDAVSECTGKTIKEISEFLMDPLVDNWYSLSSSIYNPNAANFQKILSQGTHIFVAFHVTKCSNCEQVKTEFLATAEQMEEHNFAFAAVNCDFNSDLCITEKIKVYPSFKLYKNGEFSQNYSGNNEKNSFVKFLKSFVKEEL